MTTIIKRKVVKKAKFTKPDPVISVPDAHRGPPPQDYDSYYGTAYSVPVWVDTGKNCGACVRWAFNHKGWVDYNWRDGTAPRDNDYLAKIPANAPWILLPFHVVKT